MEHGVCTATDADAEGPLHNVSSILSRSQSSQFLIFDSTGLLATTDLVQTLDLPMNSPCLSLDRDIAGVTDPVQAR